jgi:hypothetical protein
MKGPHGSEIAASVALTLAPRRRCRSARVAEGLSVGFSHDHEQQTYTLFQIGRPCCDHAGLVGVEAGRARDWYLPGARGVDVLFRRDAPVRHSFRSPVNLGVGGNPAVQIGIQLRPSSKTLRQVWHNAPLQLCHSFSSFPLGCCACCLESCWSAFRDFVEQGSMPSQFPPLQR